MVLIGTPPKVVIHEREIKLEFIRSSGPGGQNVNKVATAVLLRFDVLRSPSLTSEIKQRLIRLAGKRMTSDGTLVIKAERYRTQERNRQDAVDRLTELIRKAAEKPRHRIKTRPTASSRERRLAGKQHRSRQKKLRRAVRTDRDHR